MVVCRVLRLSCRVDTKNKSLASFAVKFLSSDGELELKKDILTLLDLEKEDFDRLFERAFELKALHKKGRIEMPLKGKTLGLIFDKHSTRTRLSFEAAMIQLGGSSIFISARDTQMARSEPVRDTARVLSRYLQCLAIRTYSQDLLQEFADF